MPKETIVYVDDLLVSENDVQAANAMCKESMEKLAFQFSSSNPEVMKSVSVEECSEALGVCQFTNNTSHRESLGDTLVDWDWDAKVSLQKCIGGSGKGG